MGTEPRAKSVERREDAHGQRRRASPFHQRKQLLQVVARVSRDPLGQDRREPVLLELELPPVHRLQPTRLLAHLYCLCLMSLPLAEITYHLPPLRFRPSPVA